MGSPCAGLEETVAMFRAQRNLYIVGATLGLALVIRRVAMLAVTLGRVREERKHGLLRLQTVVEENHEADRKYKLAKFDLIHHSKDVVKKKNIFQTFSLIHWHTKQIVFA